MTTTANNTPAHSAPYSTLETAHGTVRLARVEQGQTIAAHGAADDDSTAPQARSSATALFLGLAGYAGSMALGMTFLGLLASAMH